jgi:hypothetical protein
MYRVSIETQGRIVLDVDVPEVATDPESPAGPYGPAFERLHSIDQLIIAAFHDAAAGVAPRCEERVYVRIMRWDAPKRG